MMLRPCERPLVVGHRGARGLYPENTFPGFSEAIALGVDALELDVAVAADNVAIVAHDPRLNPDIARGSDGNWLDRPTPLVRELTFEQLSEYDIGRLQPGSAYAAAFPEQRRADGARIPSLAEVVAATGQVSLLIEMKTSPGEPELAVAPAEMAELVVDVLSAASAVQRSMILSFDWRGLRHLRRSHPEIATGWLTEPMDDGERRRWRGDELGSRRAGSPAAIIAQEGGRCWLPEWRELRWPDLAAAQQLGLLVGPRRGPTRQDALITDRPDLALKIAQCRKRSRAPDVA